MGQFRFVIAFNVDMSCHQNGMVSTKHYYAPPLVTLVAAVWLRIEEYLSVRHWRLKVEIENIRKCISYILSGV